MVDAKHVMPYRRKREGRTNYKRRLALLKSGQHRLVLRKSNRYILLQVVEYGPEGDRVILSLSSKTLAKEGWKGSGKSLPATYFTGFLLAKKTLQKGVKEAIADIGLQHHRPGNRLCAAIKGAIDGGLSIPAREDIYPSAERLLGHHISDSTAKEVEQFATKIGAKLPVAAKRLAKPDSQQETKVTKETKLKRKDDTHG